MSLKDDKQLLNVAYCDGDERRMVRRVLYVGEDGWSITFRFADHPGFLIISKRAISYVEDVGGR